MKGVRTFDFAPTTHLWEALPAIQAALADEGLTVTDSDNGTHSRVTSVLIGGVKRVIVPASRIGPLTTKAPAPSVDDLAIAMMA